MAAINSCSFCDELKVFDDQRELTRHLAQLHTRSPTLYCYRRESALFAGLVVCRAPFLSGPLLSQGIQQLLDAQTRS
jgi:hypothetical protein